MATKESPNGAGRSPLGVPIEVGPARLRNRFVATAHASGNTRDGLAVEGDAEYWQRLAEGGAAMLISGGTALSEQSTLRRRNLIESWRPEVVEGWARAARADAAPAADRQRDRRDRRGAPALLRPRRRGRLRRRRAARRARLPAQPV